MVKDIAKSVVVFYPMSLYKLFKQASLAQDKDDNKNKSALKQVESLRALQEWLNKCPLNIKTIENKDNDEN